MSAGLSLRIHALVRILAGLFAGMVLSFPVAAEDAPGGACAGRGLPSSIPKIAIRNILSGLESPVHVTHAPDSHGRIFIVEQGGIIRVLHDGKPGPKPFLDIRDRVQDEGELGLLSIAFHPDFSRNARFFVYYTSSSRRKMSRCPKGVNLCSVVSEFTLIPGRKVEQSERVLLQVSQPYSNHNGGQLAFGNDGYLYIGLGDGGAAGDPEGHGQNLSTLLGSILRIDVDKKESGLEYAIPDTNPVWKGVAGARREIWSYGLRNPWRFSFDPVTGLLYVGDVGQNEREELNIVKAGGNYGWNRVEGDLCYKRKCKKGDYDSPFLVLDHGRDGWRSITGGVVYRGKEIPELCGVYLFADYVANEVRGLIYDPGKEEVVAQKVLGRVPGVSSFGYGPDGEVYLVSHKKGQLYKVFRH